MLCICSASKGGMAPSNLALFFKRGRDLKNFQRPHKRPHHSNYYTIAKEFGWFMLCSCLSMGRMGTLKKGVAYSKGGHGLKNFQRQCMAAQMFSIERRSGTLRRGAACLKRPTSYFTIILNTNYHFKHFCLFATKARQDKGEGGFQAEGPQASGQVLLEDGTEDA